MPYGVGTRVNPTRTSGAISSSGANYIQRESTTRRHEFQLQDSTNIASGIYRPYVLAKFKRTFNPAVPDTVPTPVNSNNYQSTEVMNGSRIENFQTKFYLRAQQTGIGPFFLDVYIMALSFWDALILNTILPTNSPVTFDQTVNLEGEVNLKAPTVALLSPNEIKTFKFLQHYIKHLGTLEFSDRDADSATLVIDVPDIPAKCRRSQTGMFYAIFFLNDAQKNATGVFNLSITQDVSFMEIPASQRLPFIE